MAGPAFYDIEVAAIDGARHSMGEFRGRVLLVVNLASRCGFTPQYAALEAIHRRYVEDGLSVLGFPCEQFGHQEPGDDAEIARFCAETYDVTFPLFSKIEVNGAGAHPLFRFLKAEKAGLLGTGSIKWNFTKFLVDREGQVVARYGPRVTPDRLEGEIQRLLRR